MTYILEVQGPMPWFAEVPYALWGDVNYDSEGDCKRPTDRGWSYLELMNRVTRERVIISPTEGGAKTLQIEAEDPTLAARTTSFLLARCEAVAVGADPRSHVGPDWTIEGALARSARVRAEFPRPELAPFDSDLFWGSWKFVGPRGTEFTWVGRWILDSMLTRDGRAVALCIGWIEAGTYSPAQSAALRAGLAHLTGEHFPTDAAWIAWYRTGPGEGRYPEPDYDAWYAEQKARSMPPSA